MAKMKFTVGEKVFYYGSGKKTGTIHACRDNGTSAGTNYGFSYQVLEDDGSITDWQHELCISRARSKSVSI